MIFLCQICNWLCLGYCAVCRVRLAVVEGVMGVVALVVGTVLVGLVGMMVCLALGVGVVVILLGMGK